MKISLGGLLICGLLLSTGLLAEPDNDADAARQQKMLENQREDQKRQDQEIENRRLDIQRQEQQRLDKKFDDQRWEREHQR